jgi:hypothetical protein
MLTRDFYKEALNIRIPASIVNQAGFFQKSPLGSLNKWHFQPFPCFFVNLICPFPGNEDAFCPSAAA